MENPKIPGRFQMTPFIPVEIFQKKSNTFRGHYLFPVLTQTTEIFCTLCLDYQCQASCREKVNKLPVFCKWYNSIPFLFSVPEKYQYHVTEIFHRNFCTNGKRSWFTSFLKNRTSKFWNRQEYVLTSYLELLSASWDNKWGQTQEKSGVV